MCKKKSFGKQKKKTSWEKKLFHAKLDYFYGAIYSTKFTTTLAGSAISLKANVRANVRRGPNTMKICGRVWGYSSHCLLPAYVLLTVATTM